MTDLIVDGNSLYARSWFAVSKDAPNPEAAASLVLTTVLKLLTTDRIGVPFHRTLFCWDGHQNIRKNRQPKPPEYHATLNSVREILSLLLGTAHAIPARHEGDDAVATAIFRSPPENKIYIVSGDKDLTQLVGGNVRYYCLNNKAVLSHSFITTKWHIKQPNQVSIALAILGDRVDNIPGIHGWGPKKVKTLFKQVTEDMPFEQALETIEAQIPDDKREEFYSSLEAILLDPNVPDVPEPSPLVYAKSDVVEALSMPEVALAYEYLARR